MSLLSLLGFGEPRKKVLAYLAKGARIIDLRMPEEFAEGSIAGSLNINQDELEERFDEIKNVGGPMLLCCGSGLRSDEAAVLLREAGIAAINAGSYKRLKKIIDNNKVNV